MTDSMGTSVSDSDTTVGVYAGACVGYSKIVMDRGQKVRVALELGVRLRVAPGSQLFGDVDAASAVVLDVAHAYHF